MKEKLFEKKLKNSFKYSNKYYISIFNKRKPQNIIEININ